MSTKSISEAAAPIDEAIRELNEAKEHLATIDAAEHKALGSRDEHAAWQRQRTQVAVEIDRLSKLVAHRRSEIDRKTREAELTKLNEQRMKQNELNQALAHRMPAELQPLIDKFLPFLAEVATADIQTAQLNARLPDDQRIQTADAIARSRAMRPPQDVKVKFVDCWCFASNGTRVVDERSVIDQGDRRGYIPSRSSDGEIRCVLLKHKLISHYEERPLKRAVPLYEALRLPRFDGPDMAWPGSSGDPKAALALIDVLSRPAMEDPLLERYELAEPYGPPAHRPAPRIGSEVPVR